MPPASRIPLVDLTSAFEPGPRRDEVVDVIGRACEEIGFLVVTGHGVPDEVIDGAEASARGFFALSGEEKVRSVPVPGTWWGFTPAQGTALAMAHDVVTPPDLCETFSVSRFDHVVPAVDPGDGRGAFIAPNVWPARPEEFRPAFEDYYAAMEDLAARLMGLMALALGLDEHWFDDKISDHITGLTALHYPELGMPALPGQSRRGEHTDWGSITILHHDGEPGLQVLTSAGGWEEAPSVPGAFVVNLGDLMAAWTNDRWRSTLHRVVVPDDDTGVRISIAFFHQPDFDARIECIPTCTSPDNPPRYPPTTSGEWIVSMLDKTTR